MSELIACRHAAVPNISPAGREGRCGDRGKAGGHPFPVIGLGPRKQLIRPRFQHPASANGTLPRWAAFSQNEKEQWPMSIFGNIMSAIFKSATSAATPTTERVDDKRKAPGTGESGPTVGAESRGSTATASLERVDVAAVLTKLAAQNKEKLDWRRSIVDLMKLLQLDSSLAARKELARELHYAGDMNDSASMNMWLHKQVMQKLAENGGKVPADLTAR
jgi:uncharacterized protein DUF3597